MRAITLEAVEKLYNAKAMKKGNTEIVVLPNVTILKLFGNPIAYLYNDHERTLSIQNCGFFTPTTKERLRGLPNVRISQKNGIWFLNGIEWDGKLIDIVK
jgi:hypothetical protein